MEEQEKKQASKRKRIIIAIVASISFIIVLGLGITYSNFYASYSNLKQKISEYNEVVKNYNTVAEEYEKIKLVTSLENIDNLPEMTTRKAYIEDDIGFFKSIRNNISQYSVIQDTKKTAEETAELLYALILAQQITNPTEEWVIERLQVIDEIVEVQAVTENQDPNQLLGVEGGYTSCVYFSVKQIDRDSVDGKDIVDKGTDVGGAIEVYATITDAQNRCDYLGQFDNTLLYSGSYAIVGTTVIRTSYQLTNEQQVELTNKITEEFTAVK